MSKDKGEKNTKKPKAEKQANKKLSEYQLEKSNKIVLPLSLAKKK
jgi:hypothetical protein